MRNVFSKKTNVIISYFLVFLCLVFVFQIVNGQTPLPPVEGKIRYGFEYKTIDEVKQLELEIGAKENSTFWLRMTNKITEESLMGSFSRLAGGLRSPFTYKSPNTKKFFNFVCKIQGTEMEMISQIYQLVTDAVPNYGTPGSDVFNQFKFTTFEEVLSDCKGICRDQATLLSTALKSKGIDSRVILGQVHKPGDHMWVRVKTSDGKEFDLDPTWYKDYVELKVRSSDAKKVPVEENITTPVPPAGTTDTVLTAEEDSGTYYEDFSQENSCDSDEITYSLISSKKITDSLDSQDICNYENLLDEVYKNLQDKAEEKFGKCFQICSDNSQKCESKCSSDFDCEISCSTKFNACSNVCSPLIELSFSLAYSEKRNEPLSWPYSSKRYSGCEDVWMAGGRVLWDNTFVDYNDLANLLKDSENKIDAIRMPNSD